MSWIACLILVVLAVEGSPTMAADAVTLKDGKVLLGQVVDSGRRGPLLMVIRRAWASASVPDKLAAWEKAEAPIVRRAEAQRRDRLVAWRRDRAAGRPEGDRITLWLDAEIARLADPGRSMPPLIVVNLSRAEVKAMARRPGGTPRMLRLGWTLDLPDPETMPLGSLKQALEDRGFAPNLDSPVSLDALLPLQPETDNHWLARRAATELANDPGGRLLRYQGLLMDEPAPGEAPPAGATLTAAVNAIQGLLADTPPPDPLPEKLRDLATRGRVGAVVTQMQMAADFSGVGVESTLWVRVAGGRWIPAVVKSGSARPDAMPADAGVPLGDDPQVKAVFGTIEALGFGQVSPELKRRSLNMGAATRKALGDARKGLDVVLQALALPLDAPKPRPSAPGSKP